MALIPNLSAHDEKKSKGDFPGFPGPTGLLFRRAKGRCNHCPFLKDTGVWQERNQNARTTHSHGHPALQKREMCTHPPQNPDREKQERAVQPFLHTFSKITVWLLPKAGCLL